MDELDLLEVRIDADIGPFEHKLLDAGRLGDKFASNLTKAFGKAFMEGQRLDDVFKSLFSSLSNSAFHQAMQPLEKELNGVFSGLFSSFSSMGLPGGSLQKFEQTTDMSSFKASAIAPETQSRSTSTPQVTQRSSYEAPQQPTIVFNVHSPDADSFMRSEAQVNAMITRAATQGSRNA